MQRDDNLFQAIDNLVQETYSPTEPGAAVIVVRDGEVIYCKGQGMANLELGMPIEHLFTHTSGIKEMLAIPERAVQRRLDQPLYRQHLIRGVAILHFHPFPRTSANKSGGPLVSYDRPECARKGLSCRPKRH